MGPPLSLEMIIIKRYISIELYSVSVPSIVTWLHLTKARELRVNWAPKETVKDSNEVY